MGESPGRPGLASDTVYWLTAFLDLARADFDRGVAFWQAVTGYALSESRGDDGEFATLLPPGGDPFLKVQRLREGPGRIHLDLHVPDPPAAAADAAALGAAVSSRPEAGYVVMTSPAGLTFCLVRHRATVPPSPTTWPTGHGSLVDQVCLDIPADGYDEECAFWQRVTGWELVDVAEHDEFRRLLRPSGQPLRLLLQRLGEADGGARAHLDLATTDRPAEAARHTALGARVVDTRPGWTVLADPTGAAYCITGRVPETPVPTAATGD